MDIEQNDTHVSIKFGTRLVTRHKEWLVTNVGKEQRLKQHVYIPFSAVLLKKGKGVGIPELLFWFPEMKMSFQTLEEFEEYNSLR